MPSVTVKDSKGASVGQLDLNEGVFGYESNIGLMHQAVVAEETNSRQGTSDTKTRGEVRGGGRKPWRQKGTGRARQGTRRAPHWAGGGVVFGPHPRDFQKDMPKKMRRAAVKSALSAKLADDEITIVDSIALDEISTKKMAETLVGLGVVGGRTLLALDEMNEIVFKSARNIPGVTLRVVPNLSARDILNCDRLVMTRSAVQKLEEALSQ